MGNWGKESIYGCELLEALGVRVFDIPNLKEGAVYLKRRGIFLLDSELSASQREDAANEVLPILWG